MANGEVMFRSDDSTQPERRTGEQVGRTPDRRAAAQSYDRGELSSDGRFARDGKWRGAASNDAGAASDWAREESLRSGRDEKYPYGKHQTDQGDQLERRVSAQVTVANERRSDSGKAWVGTYNGSDRRIGQAKPLVNALNRRGDPDPVDPKQPYTARSARRTTIDGRSTRTTVPGYPLSDSTRNDAGAYPTGTPAGSQSYDSAGEPVR